MIYNCLMKSEPVKIKGNGYNLLGTIIKPDASGKLPSVIFYHGMISQSKPRYIKRGEEFAKVGIASLCFDFRGCGKSDGKLGELSLRDWLDDALLTLDYLLKQDFVDKEKVGISGKSFGGYMGALVCGKRNIKSMVLQAPGIYSDDWLNKKYTWDDDFKKRRDEYRKSDKVLDNVAIKAIEKFKNPLLIIGSELDDSCPRNVIEGYCEHAGSENKKLEWIKGADHSLQNEKHNEEYTKLMVGWFKNTL